MKFGVIGLSLVLSCLVWAQSQASQYLVVFKEVNARQLQSLTGLPLQKYLKQQTQFHLRQFSQDLSAIRNGQQGPLKPLWILGSVITDLDIDQLEDVKKLKNVRAVLPLNRVIKLIEPQNSLEPVNTSEFTYGLIKIGIPAVRQEFSTMSGKGIRLGIIDTGINPNHPDLKGKVKAFRDFIKPQNLNPVDDHGHGTHVAGTVAGGNSSGRSVGVAPQADLVIAKVFDSAGSSDDANLLLALQWMTDPDGNSETADAVSAVNNSWGTQTNTQSLDPGQDPFCVVLSRMRAMNVLPVFSAGNSGPRPKSIGVPGACPEAFTVGSTNSRDAVSSFSSRGPVIWKTGTLMKPDISAPGEDVYSADKNGRYSTKSGTSMASPHVTGAVALLKQARPNLSAQQLQEVLMKSSQDLGLPGMDPNFGQGRMDVLQSLKTILN
jgi:subtilisin family serine protease